MAFYVPLGPRGLLFRLGTFVIGIWGGLVYRLAYRRRAFIVTNPGPFPVHRAWYGDYTHGLRWLAIPGDTGAECSTQAKAKHWHWPWLDCSTTSVMNGSKEYLATGAPIYIPSGKLTDTRKDRLGSTLLSNPSLSLVICADVGTSIAAF